DAVDQSIEEPEKLGIRVRLHGVIQTDARQTRPEGLDRRLNVRGRKNQERGCHGFGKNRRAVDGQVWFNSRFRQGRRRHSAVSSFHLIITSLPAKLPSNLRGALPTPRAMRGSYGRQCCGGHVTNKTSAGARPTFWNECSCCAL